MITRTRLVIAALLSASSVGLVRGDDPPVGLDLWAPVYASTAADVGMEYADGQLGEVTLETDALLRYANPVRAVQQHGTIHLWTDGGRPAVVGSIWSRTSPTREGYRRMNFEWHALSQRPVRARFEDSTIWETTAAGIEWKPLPDLPAAGPNRSLRLLQMRRIATDFDAEIERGESELRLLSRPLYRYPDDVAGVVDGALFAYVMGTDPEFFVLLEARRAPDGDGTDWYAGVVRFTNSALVVTRAKKEWWSCERFNAGPRDQSYFLRFNVLELPADLTGTEFDPARGTDADEGGSR